MSTLSIFSRHPREFQIPEDFQALVLPAYERLKAAGYDDRRITMDHLLREMSDNELAAVWRWFLSAHAHPGAILNRVASAAWPSLSAWFNREEKAVSEEIRRRIRLHRHPNDRSVFRRDVDAWASVAATAREVL